MDVWTSFAIILTGALFILIGLALYLRNYALRKAKKVARAMAHMIELDGRNDIINL